MKAVLLAALLAGVLVGRPGTALALDLYMAANGSDAYDGRSPSSPIATLARAQKIIEALPPQDITINIAPGHYARQSVVWAYTMPRHAIRFVGAGDGRTVFDGERKGLTLFRLRGDKGAATNLHFRGLTITNYVTAITLNGDRERPHLFNSSNSIVSNEFVNVGGIGSDPVGYSTAVVRLVNSDQNTIRGNLFRGMTGTRCELLHAIYLAHSSSKNVVADNTFEDGCGDPIRIRDASNDNIITGNRFNRVGDRAAVSEWHCAGRAKCTKKAPECPSAGNVLSENAVGVSYKGTRLPERLNHNRPIPAGCRHSR
jgi:hypothetical protein